MSKEYHAPMHTAEHILNQTMVRMFNCKRSYSNHIEKKKSKCDYKFDRDLTEDELTIIETRVNEEIARNHNVSEEFIDIEEAGCLYNTERLPDNVGDKVRIIKVGNYDACPCIGEHVSNTAEIGKFKIISCKYGFKLKSRISSVD